jgi:muramidase (phage lysozyme)
MSSNRQAFLDMLAFSEGTSTSTATRRDGYDVIVTGVDGKQEIFTDFSAHPFAGGRPSKVINSKGLTSNASGRYQFMLKDWAHYKALLHLADFGPVSQDLWAMQLIRERSALPLIDGGNFDAAVKAVSNLWASLPGANYADQRMNPLDKLRAYFVSRGGQLAGAAPAAAVGEDTEDDSTSWGNEERR